MKQNTPAVSTTATTSSHVVEKPANTRIEDWIESAEVMELLKISENTLRKYIRQGILHYTPLNRRKLFYKPHILHALESRYR